MSHIKCPHCEHEDNRARYALTFPTQIHRVRQCVNCKRTFKTVEIHTPKGMRTPTQRNYKDFHATRDENLEMKAAAKDLAKQMGW